NLGWLGLHIPEEHGGSGYSLEELAVVVEALGRAVAPGPFVPTVIASAVIAAAGDDELKKRYLPGLAGGSTTGAAALGGSVTVSGGTASGPAGNVLGGGLAKVILVPAGDDVAVVEVGEGVTVEVPPNMDPTRRTARDRTAEFPARMSGAPYTGGGIRTTVAATPAASDAELAARAAALVAEMNAQGTTTVEIKSGYGLTVEDERRSLEIAGTLTDET